LNKANRIWALVPIKTFGKAKTRLRSALSNDQCAALARHMAVDVVTALRNASMLQGITLLGEEPVVARFARELHCDYLADAPGADLSANLDSAADYLKLAGVDVLLVLPSDLPMLRAADIDEVLNQHAGGLSICPASRDGGTNALVISPPGAIEFCFGRDSGRRHLEAAGAAELRSAQMTRAAFSRDIDTPDDLIWFCQHSSPGRTSDYLNVSRICEKLLGTDAPAIA
jgi:2-phospho-L-lactate guanylyltransferase